MLTQEEIAERLQGASPNLQVAFAARCALRVLPLLAQEPPAGNNSKSGMLGKSLSAFNKVPVDPFWYWYDKGRKEFLLGILTAQKYG